MNNNIMRFNQDNFNRHIHSYSWNWRDGNHIDEVQAGGFGKSWCWRCRCWRSLVLVPVCWRCRCWQCRWWVVVAVPLVNNGAAGGGGGAAGGW